MSADKVCLYQKVWFVKIQVFVIVTHAAIILIRIVVHCLIFVIAPLPPNRNLKSFWIIVNDHFK